MENQRSIKKEVKVKGKGIHSGNKVTLTLKPAGPNTGILFKRVDIADSPVIKAHIDHILDGKRSPRQTSIGLQGVEIQTIEHLMSALSGLKIDNILVELDNTEVPALDGSAAGFIKVLKEAQIQDLSFRRRVYSLKEPIYVSEGDSFICAIPSSKYKISYTLHHDNHPYLKTQHMDIEVDESIFEADISSSRTFVLEEESKQLLEQGLGKGASYDNTLVVSGKGIIDNTPRFEDEFLRHKILDLIGDIYLLGRPLVAHIVAIKTGHYLNHQLIKKIQANIQKERAASLQAQPKLGASGQLDIQMIKRILPHRYPFLLVDRIIELEAGKSAKGIKNVTANEMFFNGHFPGRPVMPGVLICEAMAQVGGVLMLSAKGNEGKLAFFMSMNNVKFRKPVVPGDQLVIEVVAGKIRSRAGQLFTKASVDGKVVTEAELMFALVDA
ncbi:bifunctional UDP-3-O-[3-hydroxymyristoyl] N-acetylglucosamine deacetylase/3-hydroxyacyl-ACP dehydratase [Thermoproteota archaeon]